MLHQLRLMYTSNHEQTMLCLIKVVYQKFDSVQKSWYLCGGNTFCQKIWPNNNPSSLFQNESARTFIWRLSETSLIRFFIFENV